MELDTNGIPLREGAKYFLTAEKAIRIRSFSPLACKPQDGPHSPPVAELQWKLTGM